MVGRCLLQIQHRFGNRPLTLLNQALPANRRADVHAPAHLSVPELRADFAPRRHVIRTVAGDALTRPVMVLRLRTDLAHAGVVPRKSAEFQQFSDLALSIGGELYPASDLDRLASLPTLAEARTSLVRVLAAPMTQLVRTLAEPAAMLARTLKARSEQPQP